MAAQGSIGVGDNTRIIFDLSEKRISLPVYNNSDNGYLFHAQIIDVDSGKYSRDFIPNPELVQLLPNKSRRIELVRLVEFKGLDTEKLYIFKGLFMPAKDVERADGFSMSLIYDVEMKLFVRPKELYSQNGAMSTILEKIKFRSIDDSISIENNSKYYVTFNSISINGKVIDIPEDIRMIAPNGAGFLKVKPNEGDKISWSLINDSGFPTEQQITEIDSDE